MSKFSLEGRTVARVQSLSTWFVNHNSFRNILNPCGVNGLILGQLRFSPVKSCICQALAFGSTPECSSFKVPCVNNQGFFTSPSFLKYIIRGGLRVLDGKHLGQLPLPAFQRYFRFSPFEKKHDISVSVLGRLEMTPSSRVPACPLQTTLR